MSAKKNAQTLLTKKKFNMLFIMSDLFFMHLEFMMCNCAQKPNDENPEPAVVLHRIFVRPSVRVRRLRRRWFVDEVCTRRGSYTDSVRRFESEGATNSNHNNNR